MHLDITSLPISEVFEPREGCPLCRLRDQLENRVVEYITGAALMEPDVRTETNRQGFCLTHYRMMLKRRNRLGVALLLQSHLDTLDKRLFSGGFLPGWPKRAGRQAEKAGESCFVCGQVDQAMERLGATVCRLWEEQRAFRQLFEEQPSLCLPHFIFLQERAVGTLSKKSLPDFLKASAALCRRSLNGLREDVSRFCDRFDYRYMPEGPEEETVTSAVERSVAFLTAREP